MGTTLTIDRTGQGLPPLIITGSRDTTPSGLWLPVDGLREPSFQPRYRYAPDTDIVDGRTLLSVVRDQSTLPLTVRARGADAASLAALRQEFTHALAQFMFDITLDRDGVSTVFEAVYSVPEWDPLEPWMRVTHQARATVVIPVNPT